MEQRVGDDATSTSDDSAKSPSERTPAGTSSRPRWLPAAIIVGVLTLAVIATIAYALGRDAADEDPRPAIPTPPAVSPPAPPTLAPNDTATALDALRDARKILDDALLAEKVRVDVCVDLNNQLDHVHELLTTRQLSGVDEALSLLARHVDERVDEGSLDENAGTGLKKALDDIDDAVTDR